MIRRTQHKSSHLQRPQRGNESPILSGHNPRKSSISTEDRGDDSLNDAKALDAMHFLLSTLTEMTVSNPLAKILERQISQEMAEEEATTRDRVVGLVNFPLAHPTLRNTEGG